MASRMRTWYICDLDGPGSFCPSPLIDIKVTDSCGPTAVSRLHSDTTRHASHSHISRQSSLDYTRSIAYRVQCQQCYYVLFSFY